MLTPPTTLFQMQDDLDVLRKKNERLRVLLDQRDEAIAKLGMHLQLLEAIPEGFWPGEFLPHLFCLIDEKGDMIHFLPAEWKILSMLFRRRDHNVTQDELYNTLCLNRAHDKPLPTLKIIHVYISRIRVKLRYTNYRVASSRNNMQMGQGTYSLLSKEVFEKWERRKKEVFWKGDS